MKVFQEAEIYFVSKTTQCDSEIRRFLDDHDVRIDQWNHLNCGAVSSGELMPELAGRLCYLSFNAPRPGGNTAYLRHIKESGHGSVLEHSVFSFVFTRVSRALSHELVRHRAGWSYSQTSQRYVDESVCEVMVPPDLREEVKRARQFIVSLRDDQKMTGDDASLVEFVLTQGAYRIPSDYDDRPALLAGLRQLHVMAQTNAIYQQQAGYLSEKIKKEVEKSKSLLTQEDKTSVRKRARQAARSVLPNATETKIFVTANARAWRNAIEQRCSRFADPEIRVAFYKVWKLLVKDSPNLFCDYVEHELEDKTIELRTEYRKV